ncbi:hypothetical protein M409DRAFT_57132 [Zasmidium cellare ATCC 36951]|uniref:Uncharacterized protein n=1 Tax=Zasmidium cellare ATCC 36951 TaxID=1080233 RepID=A0A6A6CCY3_ZASCE|nr:uncharacterized protein M409DRAFT_57132 [Zasmidium cellare ATCC 36951]KAF2164038.1 hypothetical protein M409DRAFT_57132 [Zasmidium cellare ATCC 36951]
MSFDFLSLPAELGNMVYRRYLSDDLSATAYFNQQVRLAQLHVPGLARAYGPQPPGTPGPDIYNEVITYFYGQMEVTMDLRRDRTFWDYWTMSTATNDFVAHLRKFEMVGRTVCDGVYHDKIFIDLNNTTNPVSSGNDQPEVHITGCACTGPYGAAILTNTTERTSTDSNKQSKTHHPSPPPHPAAATAATAAQMPHFRKFAEKQSNYIISFYPSTVSSSREPGH